MTYGIFNGFIINQLGEYDVPELFGYLIAFTIPLPGYLYSQTLEKSVQNGSFPFFNLIGAMSDKTSSAIFGFMVSNLIAAALWFLHQFIFGDPKLNAKRDTALLNKTVLQEKREHKLLEDKETNKDNDVGGLIEMTSGQKNPYST